MGLYRPLHDAGDGDRPELPPADGVPLDEWLDLLDVERQALIMKLRAIEKPLVKYKRLRMYTLPKRIK